MVAKVITAAQNKKMKIFKIMLIFSLLIFSAISVSADVSESAKAVTSEDYSVSWTKNNESVIITDYVGDTTHLIIGSTYTDTDGTKYPIVAIDNNAFYHNTKLESVSIFVGIETIRNSAFEGCENLKWIYIPDSVTWISADAFNGDTNLIILGSSKSYAEKYASEHGLRFEVNGNSEKFEVKANKENFSKSLEIMGMGMGGMFIVSISMAILITIMNIVFDPKKKETTEC
ncbi:hypothetical protein FACS1894132_09090 [Clostridia bacterium]|nr:hypothetical protein FACS1894132_09090 [Clostridia bacterium]